MIPFLMDEVTLAISDLEEVTGIPRWCWWLVPRLFSRGG
jgi:hypothetical protein